MLASSRNGALLKHYGQPVQRKLGRRRLEKRNEICRHSSIGNRIKKKVGGKKPGKQQFIPSLNESR